MAFVKNAITGDDNEESTGQSQDLSATPTISTSVGSTSAGDATAQTKQSGTGFGGLQKYLAANQQGAQNLGQQVASQVQGATQAAQQTIMPAAQQFTQQVQQGTNIFNPNAREGETEDLMGYAGPQNFAGSQQDLAIQEKINAAQQLAGNVQTEAGRTEVLKNLAPGTTQGGANLNQFLLQNTAPAWNAVNTAAQGAQGLGNQYNQVTGELMNKIQQAKQTSDLTRSQALDRQNQLYQSRITAEQQAVAQEQARIQAEAQAKQQAAAAAAQKQAQEQAAAQAAAQRQVQAQAEAAAQRQAQEQAAQQAAAAQAQAAAQAAAQQAAAQKQAQEQAAAQTAAQKQAAAQQAAALAQIEQQQQAAAAARVAEKAAADQAAAAKVAADQAAAAKAAAATRENAAKVANESKPIIPTGVTQQDMLKYKKGDNFDKEDFNRWAKATGYKGAYFDINSAPKGTVAAPKPVADTSWWDDLFLASEGLGRFAPVKTPEQIAWDEEMYWRAQNSGGA